MELGLFAAEESQELGVCFCSSLVDSELHGGHRITTHATCCGKFMCGENGRWMSVVGVKDDQYDQSTSEATIICTGKGATTDSSHSPLMHPLPTLC